MGLNLFNKILANKLKLYIQRRIHPDQVGFVPSREAKDITIRTLNVTYLVHVTNTPMLQLSTDDEKAFDQVDWSFMKVVLQQLALGTHLRYWIDEINLCPSAKVKINDLLSHVF